MPKELDIYTGELQYREIDFSFVFDGEELRLIPPADKKREIEREWFLTPLGNGAYTPSSCQIDATHLIGRCNENGNDMIFITCQGSNIGNYNSVLSVQVIAYIVCNSQVHSIAKISFSCPEINRIYPVTQAYSCSLNIDTFHEDGVFSLTMRNFDSTTTEPQSFVVDDVEVQVNFSIGRNLSMKTGSAPVSLTSTMVFKFNETNDYSFIFKLWSIAKQFIQFLCYRKNIFFPIIELSTPWENGKYRHFATMYILNESGEVEEEALKKERYIQLSYITGAEGKLLNDIAANLLYTRHFPETYKSGRTIDAARFVMITAAFEWEFRRSYPNGLPKKERTINAETAASEAIQNLIDSSSGKTKEIYKFLKKLIKSTSLENEIVKVGEDFDGILGDIGRYTYELNDESLNYHDMGERLSTQRNNFAHGNIDKDFIGTSLMDLIYMEYILYAMQLKYYGVEDKNIRKAIRDLFHVSIIV